MAASLRKTNYWFVRTKSMKRLDNLGKRAIIILQSTHEDENPLQRADRCFGVVGPDGEKAAAERIAKAIVEELGATLAEEADINIKARILNDVCTISIDTSGELLHKRGHKVAVNKAPMRENLSSLMLRQCGFKGKETVVDPNAFDTKQLSPEFV